MGEWIEWKGGAMPVDGDAKVDVVFGNGHRCFGLAAKYHQPWESTANVASYRLASTDKEGE